MTPFITASHAKTQISTELKVMQTNSDLNRDLHSFRPLYKKQIWEEPKRKSERFLIRIRNYAYIMDIRINLTTNIYHFQLEREVLKAEHSITFYPRQDNVRCLILVLVFLKLKKPIFNDQLIHYSTVNIVTLQSYFST